MKLLQATSRYSILLTGSFLLICGLVIYFVTALTIEKENEEKLLVNENRVCELLADQSDLTNIPPILVVEKLNAPSPEKVTFRKNFFYDPIEEEDEFFLELESIRKIEDNYYRLILRQVVLEPHDLLYSIGFPLLIAMILIWVGLWYMNLLISKKTWSSFFENLNQLSGFSLNMKGKVDLKDSKIDEFQRMKESVESMIEKINLDYERLKQFSENASHEMQTPLSVAQANLEECLQDPNLSERQSDLLSSGIKSIKKASRMNKFLLTLHKIDNRQFEQIEKNDACKIIDQIIELHEEIIQEKQLEVHTECQELFVNSSPDLSEMLFSNLISNAVKHSVPGSQIRIKADHNFFEIKNEGRHNSVNTQQMFERFTKGDPQSDSFGLGLSIVKSICDLYKWEISYSIENSNHIIQIRF